MRKVLIAGGGIAGLTTALCLRARHKSAEIHIFERAPRLEAVGAGVQCAPNAMRVFMALGLYNQLAPLASEPLAASAWHGDTGTPYFSQPLRKLCRVDCGAPYFQFYRPDLVRVLAEAALGANVHLHLGHTATGYTQTTQTACLHVDNASAHKSVHEGDIIIGADGIHSRLRGQMFGDISARFSGYVAWRGVISAGQFAHPPILPHANIWLGAGQSGGRHFVAYNMRAPTHDDALINFVAVQKQATWQHDTAHIKGDMAHVRAAFDGWHSGVQTLLSAADECTLWGLFDSPPLPHLSEGRVMVLGDAAHPMLPFAAQGVGAAVEDATALASMVGANMADTTTIAKDLLHYAQVRQPRTRYVQTATDKNARRYHTRHRQTLNAARFLPSLLTRHLKRLWTQ